MFVWVLSTYAGFLAQFKTYTIGGLIQKNASLFFFFVSILSPPPSCVSLYADESGQQPVSVHSDCGPI